MAKRYLEICEVKRDVTQMSYNFNATFVSKGARINHERVKRVIAIENELSGLKEMCRRADRKLLLDEVHRELAER